jgi:hypothetical protein
MKKVILLTILTLFVCGEIAAQTKTKANHTENVASVKYRLVISFISIGGGIDQESYAKIKDFIDNHPKKPAFTEHRWGKEGEVDYCLHLKELSKKEQKVFVEDVKKLITKKEMVAIYENHAYVKKGR